jgi:hypothetical protein
VKSVRGWLTSAAVALVLVAADRYRTVIRQTADGLAWTAVLVVVVVLLLAAYGWLMAGLKTPRAQTGRPADRAAAGPELCIRGCGRPAEPWDIAEEWDGTVGHLLPGRPGLCAQCAGQVAGDVRPYDPFPPSADNRPPTPDPAFDEFAAEHKELQS